MNRPAEYRGRSHRRRPMAEINVIPYIDVSLVLLIIFMVTAPMLQTGVDVELPTAAAKPVDTGQPLPVIVTIRTDGALFLELDGKEGVAVSDAELPPRVQAVLALHPGLPVLIRGDAQVSYARVVAVMAALKNAGVPRVGLMTRPPES